MNTGKNLIYQRKLKGYSQQELSEKTEVTVRTIQRIEKGDVQPHLQTLKLLAAALDIDVNELLPIENPKEEAIQKKWLLLLHATPLLGFMLPLFNVLIPLFLWIHKREDNPLYNQHGVKVINFQITVLIFYFLSFIALLTIEGYGFFMFFAIMPICVFIVLLNIFYAVKKHKCYYPLSIPFLSYKKSAFKSAATLFALAFLTSCHVQGQNNIVRLDGSQISKDSLTRQIAQIMAEGNVQGMALSIFNKNAVVYHETFGYKDYEEKLPLSDSTNIYGASFSKAVFSVLVMHLVEEGIIDLDTPLESYLPQKIYEYEPQTRWHDDFSDLKQDSLYHKITARMCLAHTSGLPNWRWDEKDHKLKLIKTPGSTHYYSGEGFVYLQVILEKIMGQGLEEMAQERIFKPLKMNRSSYEWKQAFDDDIAYGHGPKGEKYTKDTDNEPRGGSTLETTAEDYTKFMEAVLNKRLISKKSYDEIFKNQISIDPKELSVSSEERALLSKGNLGYGLGWGYLETPYGKGVFKAGNGSGFQHYSILFPETGMGIMIMTNSRNGRSIIKKLLEICLKDSFSTLEVAVNNRSRKPHNNC
ncbi:MAG: XRE family transcriptional regulator [Pseudozobellia sp.]|nr:XRE family transcriptional regulator [Pseudozobellia sp.]MBG47871.1 XRE family transcriptional regulator [Pseudozobellia sp.]